MATETKRKTILDYLDETDYARYNELIEKAKAAKAAAPRAPRNLKPKTPAEQKTALEAKIAKAQAQLEALLAAEGLN